MDVNNNLISEIIEGIFDFKVIPFFGSGMSARFGIKTWGELIDELKKELDSTTDNYLDIAQEYEDKFGREILIQKIFSETGNVEFKDEDLGVHYEILAMNPPIIYTTNWDTAIENASERISRKYYKISSLKDISEAPHYSNVIVKFHGDFTNPENIVFTRKDYQNRMAIQHPFDILFRAHILGKKVLFLGYSFSDENIDFIFSKHQELYGTDLLPKSYIISFKDKFNESRAKELATKNIETIVLESTQHLEELIRELNKSVFSKDINRQMKNFFKSRPLEVLLKSDITNLKDYLSSNDHTEEQKADKLRQVVEMKTLSSEIETELSEYLISLITSDISSELRFAILFSFQHILFKDVGNIFNIALELISWTKYDELNYSLENMSLVDVMSSIESKLTQKPTCFAIFLYLFRARQDNQLLTEKQLERIFEMLRDCKWEDIGDVSDQFTKELQEQIINDYTRQFPNLNRILQTKSIFGTRRTTSQIMKDMENMLGKNITDLMNNDDI